MDKIEYIARELAKFDDIDPDAPAVRAGYIMRQSPVVALPPPANVVHPAWVFYRPIAELALALSAQFDAAEAVLVAARNLERGLLD